jgi:hypothetical protein
MTQWALIRVANLSVSLVLDDRRDDIGASIRVERGGTLSNLNVSPDDDPIVRAVLSACRSVHRPLPRVIHVRAISHAALASNDALANVFAIAGVGGANALLGLGLSDAGVAALCISIGAVDPHAYLEQCTVEVRQLCEPHPPNDQPFTAVATATAHGEV